MARRYGGRRWMEGERYRLVVIVILVIVVECGVHFTVCMQARSWIRETGIMSGRSHEAKPTLF